MIDYLGDVQAQSPTAPPPPPPGSERQRSSVRAANGMGLPLPRDPPNAGAREQQRQHAAALDELACVGRFLTTDR